MNDFSANMQETQVIDNYISWFNSKYGITGIDEEPASLFDMFNLNPVSDPGSPLEETVYQVQNKTKWEYDCKLPLSEYDSCCGGYGEMICSLMVGIERMMMDVMTLWAVVGQKTPAKVKNSSKVIPIILWVTLASLTVITILGLTTNIVKMMILTATKETKN